MDLIIKGTRYNVHSPITLIQGKFGIEDIESIPIPIINWKEILSQFLNSQIMKIALFSHLGKFLTSSHLSWTEFHNLWNEFDELRKKMIDQSNSIQKLIGEENNLNEIARLSNSIKDLQHQKEEYQQSSIESINAGKRDLLVKLEREILLIKKNLDLQKDEYSINENRFSQYNTRKVQLEQEMNDLKRIQQNFYKEINKITAEIDRNEEQFAIYEEKLDLITLEKEDKDRIGIKANNLKQEIVRLKSHRSQQMQESKQLQIKLSENQQNQKILASNITEFHPKYLALKSEFEKQNKQYSVIQKQIEDLKQALSAKSSQVYNKRTEISPIFKYSPSIQIDQELSRIQNQFQRLLESSRITPDTLLIEITKIQQKNEEFRIQLQKYSENKKILSQFQEMIQNLKKFDLTFNTLLKAIEIDCGLILRSSTDSAINFELQMIFRDKKKIEIQLEDLTRQHRAYVIFSLIFSLYSCCDLKVIPLYVPLLPEYIITKKSITKTLEMCQDFIQTHAQFPPLIVFDPDSNIGLQPEIRI